MRFVQSTEIQDQLSRGHLVLLSNLAYSAAGEPLNCNTYDVATHAAIELKVHPQQLPPAGLPRGSEGHAL